MNPEACLQLIFDFARDGGKIALDFIDHSQPGIKPDTSVITEADKRVSALAHERLGPLLTPGNGHLLIEEEDPRRGAYLDEKILQAHPFIWSVDPIDGTRAYANRMPHYGISIGLLKDRRPWLGAVYFPSLAELFYCDGEEAYFVRAPFTPGAVKIRIVPVEEGVTSRSVMIVTDEVLKGFNWSEQECHAMIFATAVTEFCWPAIGRACGSLSRVHLWDMAGSWPIFEKAGLKLFSFDTGKPLECIDASCFETAPSPWRLKGYYILSSPGNYKKLRGLITPKPERSKS